VADGEELALSKEQNATEPGHPLSDRKKDAMNTRPPNLAAG